MLPQVEFTKVIPADYRLFQVADLFCTMELIDLKDTHHIMSKSEEAFYGSMRDMRKNYLKPMYKNDTISSRITKLNPGAIPSE